MRSEADGTAERVQPSSRPLGGGSVPVLTARPRGPRVLVNFLSARVLRHDFLCVSVPAVENESPESIPLASEERRVNSSPALGLGSISMPKRPL
ncbi:hypothetical protein EYF80_024144 [Liparis tanakae]|uniref:Uncharacterized protein n=1 Tax=Liparis tanakae TaxID=230148 RepID=A0A4Z2HK05_9TELE|nr:hypothetical protein EYF80_024144 [Liparis tanakae]